MEAIIHYKVTNDGHYSIIIMDIDELLRVYGNFHYLIVGSQDIKDWLLSYGLVTGVDLQVILPNEPMPTNHPAFEVTFPTLDLSLL